ncbi:sialate O-acetylesterase [soil metagenome]
MKNPSVLVSKLITSLMVCATIGLSASCATADSAAAPVAKGAVATPVANSEFRLGSPFSSHMVLQRDRKVAIWGVDNPGQRITITAGEKTWNATTSADGKWKSDIGPFAVGDPFTLTIAGSKDAALEDVVAGEVWIASGQSNMEFMLKNEDGAAEAIAGADQPSIRILVIPHVTSLEPEEFVHNKGWMRCTPQIAPTISAAAYHFAKELNEKLNVPIGVIQSTWGGTAMEWWTRMAALEQDPTFAVTTTQHIAALAKAEEAKPAMEAYEQEMIAWNASPRTERYIADPGDSAMDKGWNEESFDDSAWKELTLPTDMIAKVGSIDGVYVFRKSIDVPADWQGKALKLGLGAVDDGDVTYFNGVEVGRTSPDLPSAGTTPRNYEVPASLVKAGRNVIAVRVFDKASVGGFRGQPAQMTIAPEGATTGAIPLSTAWKYKIAYAEPGQPTAPPSLDFHAVPSALYNAMISPLTPYGIRGVIWYQGEANSSRASQYRQLSEIMITDWRKQFNQPDFDFYLVQLAGYGSQNPGWIELMEAQQKTTQLPHTGMAVAADIGNEGDIHPKNKQEVGHRLALIARAKSYGEKITYSGPTIGTVKEDGNAVVVSFENVGSGLALIPSTDPKKVPPFEVAGTDNVFHPATATIDGDTLRITSPEVSDPVAVRYAWKNFPTCEFYNKDGLPAPPFRARQNGTK